MPRPSPVCDGLDPAFWFLFRLECGISGKNPNKGSLRVSPENHRPPARMPLTRQPSARKSARKSTTAAKPPCTPLPPDASALLRAIESSADTAAHYVPARYLCMLLLVSKTMRAVLQQARPPASVQVCRIQTLACYACLHPMRAVLQQARLPASVRLYHAQVLRPSPALDSTDSPAWPRTDYEDGVCREHRARPEEPQQTLHHQRVLL